MKTEANPPGTGERMTEDHMRNTPEKNQNLMLSMAAYALSQCWASPGAGLVLARTYQHFLNDKTPRQCRLAVGAIASAQADYLEHLDAARMEDTRCYALSRLDRICSDRPPEEQTRILSAAAAAAEELQRTDDAGIEDGRMIRRNLLRRMETEKVPASGQTLLECAGESVVQAASHMAEKQIRGLEQMPLVYPTLNAQMEESLHGGVLALMLYLLPLLSGSDAVPTITQAAVLSCKEVQLQGMVRSFQTKMINRLQLSERSEAAWTTAILQLTERMLLDPYDPDEFADRLSDLAASCFAAERLHRPIQTVLEQMLERSPERLPPIRLQLPAPEEYAETTLMEWLRKEERATAREPGNRRAEQAPAREKSSLKPERQKTE